MSKNALKNRPPFEVGHDDDPVFKGNPAPTVRPFAPATHPEMPCAECTAGHLIRRELGRLRLTPEEMRAAIAVSAISSPQHARHIETEARRMGLL